MIKNSLAKKITIIFLTLVIIAILYFMPTSSKDDDSKVSSLKTSMKTIFLIDNNKLVAKTKFISDKKDNELIKEIIDVLTINSSKKNYLLNGFNAIIPERTKLLSFDLKDSLLKLNFSKELLDVSKENEEKMIEAIIFSLTSLKNVKNIIIFVDGELLNKLPNSQKQLPELLNRDYGVNKVYNIDSYDDVTKTIIYYVAKHDAFYYYVPVTKIDNNNISKVEIIINSLKSSPIYQTNLISYLASNTELLNYEIKENEINLTFNNYLFNDLEENDILEEVKYSIALSIKDNYDVKNLSFIVGDTKVVDFVLKNLE